MKVDSMFRPIQWN